MSLWIKKGVSIRSLKPEMLLALQMILSVTPETELCCVTGGTEDHPDRLPESLHPKGYALDIRIPFRARDSYPPELYSETERSRRIWKEDVGGLFQGHVDYDLVWYDQHLHIEFDPK